MLIPRQNLSKSMEQKRQDEICLDKKRRMLSVIFVPILLSVLRCLQKSSMHASKLFAADCGQYI